MTSLTRDHPLSQTSLSESQHSNNLLNRMNNNDNTEQPKIPPFLQDLNAITAKVFRMKGYPDPHTDKKKAEEKLSDGRNPLTLKNDPRNN